MYLFGDDYYSLHDDDDDRRLGESLMGIQPQLGCR